jgi:glycosyltransferase involved in cell wall biosynthesis
MENCRLMNMLSVVIPAYNEQEAIPSVLSELKAALDESSGTYELIVIDDGSTDDTARMVEQAGGATLASHPFNRGYGASLKTGISRASGDTILIIDGDGTYPAKYVSQLLEHLDGYDMIVGARTGKDIKMPLYRRPAKWFLSRLANYLARARIPDLNSGMRVFRRADIERFLTILPSGFSFTTTMTLAYHCNDYLVKYIPIDYHDRTGKSKIKPVRDGLNFILLILRAITYFNPLRVFLPIATGLVAVALVILVCSILFLDRVMDATVVALMIGAVQMGAFGLLADAIARNR